MPISIKSIAVNKICVLHSKFLCSFIHKLDKFIKTPCNTCRGKGKVRRTQKIKVKNSTKGQVRIYLRAEPVTEEDKAFLDQMTMTVECRNKEIFDARASETAGLTKNTLLGTFKKNGSTELEVTLHVPHEMDSTFMGKKGVVPWTFLVEEVPVDNTPDTGDWFQMTLWIGVAALLVAAITLLVILQHKRRKAE